MISKGENRKIQLEDMKILTLIVTRLNFESIGTLRTAYSFFGK